MPSPRRYALAVDQRRGGAARSSRGAAARGVERRCCDAVALHCDGDPHEITAGGPAGRTVMRARGRRPAVLRMLEMLGEALVHDERV